MDFHILTTHTRSGSDGTPLQFISGAKLEYYRRAEAIVQAFCTLVVGALLAGAILCARGFIVF